MNQSWDLRECLSLLEGTPDLLHLTKEVDPHLQLSAISKKLDGGPALVFDRLKGYPGLRVMANLTARRERVFQLFGVTDMHAFRDLLLHGLHSQVRPRLVETAPCQEVVIDRDIDLMRLLPVPWHALGDSGSFITAGVVVARDPETGAQNMSIHRLQVKGPDRTGIKIDQGRHLGIMFQKATERGQNLGVAVIVGLHPAVMLGATAMGAEAPYGKDELEIVGGIMGVPVPVVKCRSVDLRVPAMAEIVIEGDLLRDEIEEEGPFGEYTGYYCPIERGPALRIHTVTHRRNPIYYDIIGSERWMLKALIQEPLILENVRRAVPIVQDLCMTMGGCGKHHVVVQIAKTSPIHEGFQRNAILSVFHTLKDVDMVIAVDEDVDIYDPQDVEWALATRFDAAHDLMVITGARSHEINPIAKEGIRGKMGLDATVPLAEKQHFERVKYLPVEPKDFV
ncbi:MAG: UbiD family decarboxylase [Chloroflexi bacterium]|nr:UbiD family decarboxylase [Chloroflexota bacterium]